jgi:hypothetical protein
MPGEVVTFDLNAPAHDKPGPTGQTASDDADKEEGKWRLYERVFAVIGLLASIVAIGAAAIAGVEHLPFYKEHQEERLVSELVTVGTFARTVQLLGAEPDYESQPLPGETLYDFERPWEEIQILVSDPTDSVMSVGIYAKTTSFKTNLYGDISLNGPLGNQGLSYLEPVSAAGSCGASWSYYFQIYNDLPDVDANRSIALGILADSDTNAVGLGDSALCHDISSPRQCSRRAEASADTSDSVGLFECLESFSNWGHIQATLPAAVVIVTAPHQSVTSAMLTNIYMQSG